MAIQDLTLRALLMLVTGFGSKGAHEMAAASTLAQARKLGLGGFNNDTGDNTVRSLLEQSRLTIGSELMRDLCSKFNVKAAIFIALLEGIEPPVHA